MPSSQARYFDDPKEEIRVKTITDLITILDVHDEFDQYRKKASEAANAGATFKDIPFDLVSRITGVNRAQIERVEQRSIGYKGMIFINDNTFDIHTRVTN